MPDSTHLRPDSLTAQMLEVMARCVFVLDEDLRVVYANSEAFRFFENSYRFTMETGRRFLDFLPAAETTWWRSHILEGFKGDFTSSDFERRTPDGEEQVLEVEVSLLEGAEDAPTRLMVLFDDVTARRLYERDLLQMHDALQEANRTRDTIFSILSHDLRSPIAQLNALLYFLRRAPERLSREKIAEYVRNLEDSTRHLSKALDNLLQWSSLHRHSIEPRVEIVNVAELAAESSGLVKLDAQRKAIKIGIHSPDPLEIPTDRDMLSYIMRNLLANAVKFSQRNGLVSLSQKIDADGRYVLKVIDKGVGMSRDHLLAVRDPNRNVSTAGTLGEKGIGLGLSLCREFCGMLGGEVNIESTPGSGTTVTIHLPGDWPEEA